MNTNIIAKTTNNNFSIGRNGKDGKNGKDGASFLATSETLDCSIGNIGDTVLEISTCSLYKKVANTGTVFPTAPNIKEIPQPTGNTILVGTGQTYTTIASAYAVASAGDELLLNANETFTVTQSLSMFTPVTIRGQVGTVIEMTAPPVSGVPYIFNVSPSSGTFVFRDFEIRMTYQQTLSIETCIVIGNALLTDVYIDNCKIGVNEFGISSNSAGLQVTNCEFYYASPQLNNSFRYIFIKNIKNDYIIANNTFTTGSGDSRCWFVSISNITVPSWDLSGTLLLQNNTQLAGTFTLRHFLGIEEFKGNDFKLFIIGNSTNLEGNMPILFSSPDNSIFEFIVITNNTFQNTAGKGVIGVYTEFGATTGTTTIFEQNNSITNQTFTSGWISATNPTSIYAGWDELQGTNPLFTLNQTNCFEFLGKLCCTCS